MSVIWHDLECGSYHEDMDCWRELADEHGDPVLDVGAGTGRIAIDLARHGHRVTALDRDRGLLDELAHRAAGLDVETVLADARAFELAERFPLVVVPMQTIQLLGGELGRLEFLRRAERHLASGGLVAVAITEALELFDGEDDGMVPVPDVRELGGVVYSSQPTAVREEPGGFVLERRRESVSGSGRRTSEQDRVYLDRLTADQLEREGEASGLVPRGRRVIQPTSDHVGSVVVMLGG